MRDFISEVLQSLSHKKTRTLITAFGVFWGIFLLVVLIGFGRGLKNGVDSQFAGTGNTVYLWRAAVTQIPYKGYPEGRWVGLDDRDIEALRNKIIGVETVIGINEVGGWSQPQYVTTRKSSGSYVIQGTHQEVPIMNGYQVLAGRYVNHADNMERKRVAVLGEAVYQHLFGGRQAIGESIVLAGVRFSVIGVFTPLSTGPQSAVDSQLVLIPNSTLRSSFNQVDFVNLIRLSPKPGFHAEYIEAQAKTILKKRWSVHPQDSSVYGSYNTQVEYDRLMSVFKGIELFSWFVAVGTIISGVIGVSNIMLISVKERTSEIGLRKSVGAQSSSILNLILQEALWLVLAAGYLGLIFGVSFLSFSNYVSSYLAPNNSLFSRPEIDSEIAILALLVLTVAGVMSAVFPAIKATKVSPIQALKEE